MIAACLDYLAGALRQAGVPRVYTTAEEASRHEVVPYAVVAVVGDELKYDGSLVAVETDLAAGTRTYRRRLYRWVLRVDVKVAHKNEAAVWAAADAFLAGLERRIWDGKGNAILVAGGPGEPEEEASLLQQKAVTNRVVRFEGGIYRDHTVYLIDLGANAQIEPEIGEV